MAYRPGRVTYALADSIGWHRITYMHIPTFLDLADSAFLGAHCFTFGGSRHEPHGPAVLEIDFRPADALRLPDVSGVVYLDSADYVVRRAVFTLSNAKAVDPSIRALTVTTTFDQLFPLLPVLDSVVTIREVRDGNAGAGRTTTQDDYLLRITFEGQFPGDQPTASRPTRAQ
jgi:hypothetical protein